MKTNALTADLTGAALDWAVARCEGRENDGTWDENFSSNWLLGGPIIEREGIDVQHHRQSNLSVMWTATIDSGESEQTGPTPLIAAMRCFAASRLGDEIEIPDELIDNNEEQSK